MILKVSLTAIRLLILAAHLAAATNGLPARTLLGESATIPVTTSQDELNTDGDCSLREALVAANTNSPVDACPAGLGADEILLPVGNFRLTLRGDDDDANAGDLDILEAVTIHGAGKDQTILDAQNLQDRIFHILASGDVDISRLTIQNGMETGGGLLGGGGILNESGNLTLQEVTLRDNQTNKVGGGLDNAANATLINVYIAGNHAAAGGGIFNGGSLFIQSSTLSGNSANDTGGGLDNALNATLENVTVSANTTPITTTASGGGIFTDGPLFLLNSTIAGNSIGINNQDVVRVKNTMVVNSLSGENCAGTGSFITEGNNLDSGDSCNFNSAGDLVMTDPMLGPLTDNEGPTLTHALLPGSPAIDAANDLDCPTHDQRGAARPADGDGDQAELCDIGAFEFLGVFPEFVYLPVVSR